MWLGPVNALFMWIDVSMVNDDERGREVTEDETGYWVPIGIGIVRVELCDTMSVGSCSNRVRENGWTDG